MCEATQWAIDLHWKSTMVPFSQIISRLDNMLMEKDIPLAPWF